MSGNDFTVTRASSSLTYVLRSGSFNGIDVGEFSMPAFTDLDHDGLIDMLVGREVDGFVSHYEQSSANSTSFTLRSANLGGLSGHYNSIVSVTDIDGDGLLEMVVGSGAGNFRHYEQTAANSASFTLLANDFNNIFSTGGTTFQSPHFTDIDGDGLLDLLVGDEFLSRYEQTAPNGTATGGSFSVTPASVGGSITGSTSVCTGSNSISLTLRDQVGNVVKWQSSTASNFSNPADIHNTTTSLTATNLSQTTYFRAVVQSGSDAAVNSSMAIVTVNPLPTAHTVTGGGAYVSGGAGVAIGLDGSQNGVNYQLKHGVNIVGVPVSGTGGAVSFGIHTEEGTYTVVATAVTTDCKKDMTGSAVITITPRPVTLISFAGEPANEGNHLKWKVTLEENFDHYQVERSLEPRTGFKTITRISGGQIIYNYLDLATPNGLSYYRLKMVDRDGAFAFSRLIGIGSKVWGEEMISYPNPVLNGEFKMDRTAQVNHYGLHDTNGRPVKLQMTEQNREYVFKTELSLQPGVYISSYEINGRMLQQKIIVK